MEESQHYKTSTDVGLELPLSPITDGGQKAKKRNFEQVMEKTLKKWFRKRSSNGVSKRWLALVSCLLAYGCFVFFNEITISMRRRRPTTNVNIQLELNVDRNYRFSNDGRGWHWLNRQGPPSVEDRLALHPYKNPMYEDPGEEYLPFNGDLAEESVREASTLYYDMTVIRLNDQFGFIDDMKSYDEYVDILQQIVDIFAVANVYLRFNVQDIKQTFELSRRKSLAYLQYAEGPDLAEQIEVQSEGSTAIDKKRQAYISWFKREMRKEYPVSGLELLLRGPKSGLTIASGTEAKQLFQRAVIDWVVGYPMLMTPWDVVHSTTLFPMFLIHSSKQYAQASGGRILGGTGSCHANPRKVIVDGSVDRAVKNATCKAFERGLIARSKTPVVVRDHERIKLDAEALARAWAHEIGMSLGLSNARSSCYPFEAADEALLMLDPKNVGKAGGCSPKITLEKLHAKKLSSKHIERLRKYVRGRDIRPSRTLPGAVTVGESVQQLGSRSPSLFQRLLNSDRKDTTGGPGRRVVDRAQPCTLPQNVVVLNQLKVPKTGGQIYRIRWLPSNFKDRGPAGVRVMVVQPRRKLEDLPLKTTFDIIRQSDATVPAFSQRSHVEVDLSSPLLIEPGQYLAISRTDGKRLNIDHRMFASDKVLYADVVGTFYKPASNLFDSLMRYLRMDTTYPRIAVDVKNVNSYYYANSAVGRSELEFEAFRPGIAGCSQLIVNFDLVVM